MAKPSPTAKLSQYERFCRFTVHALEARQDMHDKAELARAALLSVKAYRRELKRADNAILAARAFIAWWDVRLDATIRAVGAGARAVEANDPRLKLLGLLFGNKTPSEVTKPSGAGLAREIDDAEKILEAFKLLPPEGAAAVLAFTERLRADVDGAKDAVKRLDSALAQRELVARKKPALKQDIRDTFDRLEGQLITHFPGQRDVVASFFLPADLSRAGGDDDDNVDEDEEMDDEAGEVRGVTATAPEKPAVDKAAAGPAEKKPG